MPYWTSGNAITYDSTSGGQFYWDGTNHRLGIGSATPANKLDVVGAIKTVATASGTPPIMAYATDGTTLNARLGSWTSDSAALALYNSSGALKTLLYANGDSYITGGNVGIGTTTPQKTFSVVGTSAFTLTGNGAGTPGTLDHSWSSPQHRLAFGTDGTGYGFSIAKNTAGTYSDLLTVMTSGNVGIGTASPGDKLHVYDSTTAVDNPTIRVEGAPRAAMAQAWRRARR